LNLNNESVEVQLAAVRKYGDAIQYISDPCVEVQLAAVGKWGNSFKHISDPCVEVQLAAVDNRLVIEGILLNTSSVRV